MLHQQIERTCRHRAQETICKPPWKGTPLLHMRAKPSSAHGGVWRIRHSLCENARTSEEMPSLFFLQL